MGVGAILRVPVSAGNATPGAIRPMIGITGRRVRLGLVDGLDKRYGHLLTDTFMSDFSDRIARAGGIPVNLPYDADPEALCHWLAGVVITGGQDVHPAYWGGDLSVVRDVDPRDNPMVHDPERDEYEIALVRAALDRTYPGPRGVPGPAGPQRRSGRHADRRICRPAPSSTCRLRPRSPTAPTTTR